MLIEEKNKIVYYLDGYHGGIRGHMPLGAWRDILECLKAHPEWRINIDVEPVSWDYLKERDPVAYEELSVLVRENSENGRVEIVAGSYGQPYGWITDGESNLRHLILGREILRKHFPEISVDTYAVQEPCWTSALPQMLRQLGYRRASLKNASTAWAGYSEGYPAETVDWMGPDGTSVPTIPRYTCEGLLPVYSTEAQHAKEEYMEKCIQAGITHPVGMYFQDLGWSARPGVSDEEGVSPDYIEYTTVRHYFEAVANEKRPAWQPGQEIFRGALPWGDQTLVRMARQVRRCEAELLDTERLHAVAVLFGYQGQEARLKEAMGHLLMTQHHDGWICADTGEGEENWAFKAAAQVYAAEFIFDRLNRESFACITESIPSRMEENAGTVTVFNPLAQAEKRLVRMRMTAKSGIRGFEVCDGEKKLPCQVIAQRWYRDGSCNAGELLFLAELPALGIKTFTVRPLRELSKQRSVVRVRQEKKNFILENEYLSIQVDLERGGVITSYYDRTLQQDLVPRGAAFHEFRGYFVEEGRFCSNTEQPAEGEIERDGELEALICIRGKIARTPYVMHYRLQAGSPRLEIQVVFDFKEPTHIGEPHEIPVPEEGHCDPHRSYHDGRFRLNACFPTTFRQKTVHKDCAYDVCRSRLSNTHFKSWEEIKHNILLHWVDVSDDNQGFCVFCDHTTAYSHGEDTPLGLALAWGYDGGYWWGRRTLTGRHELRYQLMSHGGDWQEAGLWHECERFLHPPMARRSFFVPEQKNDSIFEILTEGVELGAFYFENGEHYVRIFNAGKAGQVFFRPDRERFDKMEETSPDGNPSGRWLLPDVEGIFCDSIPAFGIRTYRLGKIRRQ